MFIRFLVFVIFFYLKFYLYIASRETYRHISLHRLPRLIPAWQVGLVKPI